MGIQALIPYEAAGHNKNMAAAAAAAAGAAAVTAVWVASPDNARNMEHEEQQLVLART